MKKRASFLSIVLLSALLFSLSSCLRPETGDPPSSSETVSETETEPAAPVETTTEKQIVITWD